MAGPWLHNLHNQSLPDHTDYRTLCNIGCSISKNIDNFVIRCKWRTKRVSQVWQNRIPQGHQSNVCISQPAGCQAWLQMDASNNISIRNWTATSTDVHECPNKSGLKMATADRWDQCHPRSTVDTTLRSLHEEFSGNSAPEMHYAVEFPDDAAAMIQL